MEKLHLYSCQGRDDRGRVYVGFSGYKRPSGRDAQAEEEGEETKEEKQVRLLLLCS